MLPTAAPTADGRLVTLDDGPGIPVDLYWQQWNLRSELLDAVAAAVLADARLALG